MDSVTGILGQILENTQKHLSKCQLSKNSIVARIVPTRDELTIGVLSRALKEIDTIQFDKELDQLMESYMVPENLDTAQREAWISRLENDADLRPRPAPIQEVESPSLSLKKALKDMGIEPEDFLGNRYFPPHFDEDKKLSECFVEYQAKLAQEQVERMQRSQMSSRQEFGL